jgi:hypothetical protein
LSSTRNISCRLTDFYNRREDDPALADILATFVVDRINELREWAIAGRALFALVD